MVKKLITIALLLIFFSMNIVSSQDLMYLQNSVLSDRNTLYVGGTGPNNYTKIQDAVDDASYDDTVFVYHGIYYEDHIRIEKSINIIGENKDTTVITTNGSMAKIILITVSNVKISRFTIKAGYMGIGIYGPSTNNNISNNLFTSNSQMGIYVCDTENNIIQENEFIECGENYGRGGIYLISSDYNIILNNSFSKCGIDVSYSYHNLVDNNLVNGLPLVYVEDKSNLDIETYAGQIILINCEKICIKNQNIANIDRGIILYSSNNCLVKNNTITKAVIGIYSYQSNGNILSNNSMSFCSYYGIEFEESHDNIISNNCISSISKYGIYFDFYPGYFVPSNNNLITCNEIQNNYIGICISESGFTNISNNKLINNTFRALNIGYTINTSVTKNDFIHNHRDAYFVRCTNTNWNNNYWGRMRFLPKPIIGLKKGKILPFRIGVEFDRHPASEPFF